MTEKDITFLWIFKYRIAISFFEYYISVVFRSNNNISGELTMLIFEEGMKVLFTGDSITDCGRDRSNVRNLGYGYAQMIASRLGADFAELNLEFFNTGISGNRICDLSGRWVEDCIALKPDVVSILIGVNDTWHSFGGKPVVPAEEFKKTYREIIDKTLDALPHVQLILLEPFVLPTDEQRVLFRPDLDPKIHVVRELAMEFADAFLPLDGMFAEAACRVDMTHWLSDGVHPTMYGHSLIADAWIDTVGV